MADPGPRIGAGRAADVFDIGGGRVLRRYRDAQRHSAAAVMTEARVMHHMRDAGYPVPELFDAAGLDLVMQRLDGPSMLDDLGGHPWRTHRHADTLADLHRRLASVAVGDLAGGGTSVLAIRFGEPEAILHLDLHPGNVVLTADGPMVIDWTNAALGPPAADAAQTWLIIAASTLDEPWLVRLMALGIRRRFVGRFLARRGRAQALAMLPAAAAHRLRDRNVRPGEAERIRRLVARHA